MERLLQESRVAFEFGPDLLERISVPVVPIAKKRHEGHRSNPAASVSGRYLLVRVPLDQSQSSIDIASQKRNEYAVLKIVLGEPVMLCHSTAPVFKPFYRDDLGDSVVCTFIKERVF